METAYRPLTMIGYRDVPIVINSFNRLESLRRLVSWAHDAGHRDLVILDNASSYEPLLAYLRELERTGGARVVHLGDNFGHRSIWLCDILTRLRIETEFVYTDPDVVPASSCAPDIVEQLQRILHRDPGINKAGLGLRIDDLPEHYRHKASVVRWERQFWRTSAGCGLFYAPIDTTFALYRPHGEYLLGDAVRTGYPNVAAHEAWYGDFAAPTAEDIAYAAAAKNGNWGGAVLKDWLREAIGTVSAAVPALAHLRFGRESIPGYFEIDDVGALRALGDRSLDGVLACHGIGGIAVSALLDELARRCKAGALVSLRDLDRHEWLALRWALEARRDCWTLEGVLRAIDDRDGAETYVATLRACAQPDATERVAAPAEIPTVSGIIVGPALAPVASPRP